MTDFEPLGVELMDRDHPAIEARLQALASLSEIDPASAFDEIEGAISKHFADEEALMRTARVPIYPIHKQLHDQILAEFSQMRARLDLGQIAVVAAFLREQVPQAIAEHVAGPDTVTAGFLRAPGS